MNTLKSTVEYSTDESILLAAAANSAYGYEILLLFSDKCPNWNQRIEITSRLLSMAAGNGQRVLELFLTIIEERESGRL